MRLFIIRHAQADYRRGIQLDSLPPAERSFLTDPELSETGRQQAALLSEHLKPRAMPANETQPAPTKVSGFAISRLYCSPMRRALQTARPVAAALGLPAEIWLDVHEVGGIRYDAGDGRGPQGYAGLSRAEVAAQFPGFVLPADFAEAGWWDRPPEQEEYVARLRRVARAVRAMARSGEGNIAVITHGTAANCLLHALFGSESYEEFYFCHANTGITSVDFSEDETFLRYHNRLDHLPDSLIT